MVRPRFHKLPAEQQQTIVRAALAEFASHGFVDASLNRIIDAAGISKGSLYYYFDDKADLYAHVARQQLTSLVERAGPFPVPAAADAEAFWATLSDYYRGSMQALLGDPASAAVIRGWLAAAGSAGLQQAQRDLEESTLPWFLAVLARGQELGAVRADLPAELLIAVVFGMGQAMDLWLIGSGAGGSGAELSMEDTAPALIGMIRRALQP